jgi:methylmalonyl-CoA epimerase
MFNKLRVVHIAVNSADEAAADYSERFGLEKTRSAENPALGIRTAVLPVGDAVVEFIEPIDKEQGALSRFLQNRGEGIYMMGWEVDSVDDTIKALQERGVRLTNADPEARAAGANVFIHPKSAHGVLIELIEKPA